MTRKDVNLVIRARDEAAGVVEKINKALEEFRAGTQGLETSAGKAGNTLNRFGAAIAGLDKAIDALDIRGKLDAQLRTAEQSIGRLERQLGETSIEFARLDKAVTRNSQSLDRARAKQDGATRALARQKAVIADARKEQDGYQKALDATNRRTSVLQNQQAKLTRAIADTGADVREAASRYERLSTEIEQVVKPTVDMQRAFNGARNALSQKEAQLARLQGRYDQVTGELRAAGSAAVIFGQQLDQASRNLVTQERALSKIESNAEGLSRSVKALGESQKQLEGNLSGVTRSLQAQDSALEKAGAEYLELAANAGQAERALRVLGGDVIQKVERELLGQRRATLEAKRAYVELSREATELATSIGRAGVPTREMAQNFERLKIDAREAKTAYETQRQSLELMGRAFREAGNDTQALINASQRIAQVQQQTRTALQQTANAANQQRSALANAFGQFARAETRSRALAESLRQQNVQARAAAGGVRSLSAAWRDFYGGSRQSLSFLQRIRGEVLALTAAYGGLFGALNTLGQSLQAVQTIEAANARLTVATGSTQQAEIEFDFLRRTADRLGIQLGVLSQEYSKFAIATKTSNITAQETREIFTGIAEAARVNRSSTVELSGVFTALTQIVSKGAVQQEELRQQLGDRLPGALSIMADALGITTQELVKMTEQGEITERALIPFARELRNRFGDGLDDSLNSISASLGRLGNAAFQALARFAQAGFSQAFQELIDKVTELLQSADFESFIDRLSAGLASLVSALSFVVDNFQLFTAAVAALIGLKVGPILVALAGRIADVGKGALTTAAALRGASASAAATTGSFGALAATSRALGASLAFLASTGAGLAVAAVAAGLAIWATEAESATEALNAHRKIVDEVKNAYELANGSVDVFFENFDNVTATEARENLEQIQDAIKDTVDELLAIRRREGAGFANTFFGDNFIQQIDRNLERGIDKIIDGLAKGKIPVTELANEFDQLFEAVGDDSRAARRLGGELIDVSKRLAELVAEGADANDVILVLTGTTEEATAALERLNNASEDAISTESIDKAIEFNAQLDILRGIIDELTPKAEDLETALQIEGAFEEAIKNAQTLADTMEAIALRDEALNALGQRTADRFVSGATDAVGILSDFLREEEGFRETPYWDVNANRIGFGSDTITAPDGSVRRVQPGDRVTREDANRDLVRRLETEFLPRVASQIGQDRFDRLSPQQVAALGSIAYNSGSLPRPIVNAIISGGDVGQAILDDIQRIEGLGARGRLSDTEVRVVSERRRREAGLFNSTANDEARDREFERDREQQQRDQQRQAEERQRQAEKEAEIAARAKESIDQQIEDEQFLLSIQDLSNVERETALALREAERTAAEAGIQLTDQQRQGIIANTRAKFEQKDIDEARQAVLDRANEAQRQLNLLEQQYQALKTQRDAAEEAGQTEEVARLNAEMEALNTKLAEARENALAMWAAVGGQEAATASEQIRAAAVSTEELGNRADNTRVQWERVGDLFGNGLTNAFMSFAQAVAEGKDAGEAAREAFLKFAADFLIQIAQMIIRAAIFRALTAAFGGTGFGNLIGIGTGHTGGLVGSKRIGSGNASRSINPAMFAFARRFHEGGIPGLKPGEVPAILKENEEVLTRDDPRHMLNGGASGGGGRQMAPTIINAVDGSDALEQALSTTAGGDILMNYVRANRTQFKAALEE